MIDLSDSLGPLTPAAGSGWCWKRTASRPDRGARPAGVEWFGRPDSLGVAEAEALARRLAPCRTPVSAARATRSPC